MRGSVILLSVFVLSCTCKKDTSVAPPSPQKCTPAALHVVDPEKCELSCFAGEVAACDVASTLFQRGLHTRRDPGRTLSIAAKGCDLGGAMSCVNAVLIFTGNYDNEWPDGGVYANAEMEADYQRQAKAAAVRECNAGRFDSCALAETIVDEPERGALEKRAFELMDKACATKDGFACEQLANAYRTGSLGQKRDAAKEATLHSAACTHGQPEACEPAGNAKRGCELGSGAACLAWSLQATGPESAKALTQACELREGRACAALARKAEGDDAEKLMRRACAFGHEAACGN